MNENTRSFLFGLAVMAVTMTALAAMPALHPMVRGVDGAGSTGPAVAQSADTDAGRIALTEGTTTRREAERRRIATIARAEGHSAEAARAIARRLTAPTQRPGTTLTVTAAPTRSTPVDAARVALAEGTTTRREAERRRIAAIARAEGRDAVEAAAIAEALVPRTSGQDRPAVAQRSGQTR